MLKRRWEDLLSHLSGQDMRSLSRYRDSQQRQDGQGAIPMGDSGCGGDSDLLLGSTQQPGCP